MTSLFYGPRDGGNHDPSEPITAFGERLVIFDVEIEAEPENDNGGERGDKAA